MRYLTTTVTEVSDEARELIEAGVLILFAHGAPPELAEVSVLHRVVTDPTAEAPAVGATLTIAGISTRITAIGEYAWKKVREIGHVVINFNAQETSYRPGDISVGSVDLAQLLAALKPGVEISFES
jgi:PTS system glucitol/sorbitol-specific IIA component